jgi:DNA-binding transcriptional MocR family regulator
MITGRTAVKIASDIEAAIRNGHLQPGERLPAVRELAQVLKVSPATVANAYHTLQSRAVVVAQNRRGTCVSHHPRAAARRPHSVPKGAVILNDGNPDPRLLPSLQPILSKLQYKPHLYGDEPMHKGLIAVMRRLMRSEGVSAGHCAVVNGAMDGIDRILGEHLRPGDRIAVEDPGFSGHHDLLAARGLSLVPVAIDEAGMMPDSLERACAMGIHAILITPRVQSPTGAALSEARARELRRILSRVPQTLIIEDDHASFICEHVSYQPLHQASGRWAHLRSFSKSFNPDLRLAVMTGDDQTMMRILDRLVVIERWVSNILQSAAHALVSDVRVRAKVRQAGRTYDRRRVALMTALQGHGLSPIGSSGYNVWLPVAEETSVVQELAAAGWAVAAGERFRLKSSPGLRITVSRLEAADGKRFAASLSSILSSQRRVSAV